MRPPRRCPAPPRAPGCPAPIPSAGPISFGAAALPGMGIENTERGRPKTLVPFAPPGSPWLGAPRAPWAARRRASAPAPSRFSLKLFSFSSRAPRRRRRRRRRRPRPRRSRPRRSRRSLFGAWHLSSRPLASASSSARAARRRARPSRGGSRRSSRTATASRTRPPRTSAVHPPACSALPATTRRRTGWCPSSFLSSFFVTRSVVLPRHLRRSRRGRPNATRFRVASSRVSPSSSRTFRRSSRVPQRRGVRWVWARPRASRPPPGTCSAPWTCRPRPRGSSSLSLEFRVWGGRGQRAPGRDACERRGGFVRIAEG